MGDLQPVCCMCGDIGFPDKLSRCTKCCNRFQHSYCSNYYDQSLMTARFCDFCLSEERSGKCGVSSRKSAGKETVFTDNRSEYSGEKSKQSDKEAEIADNKGKGTSGAPSPKPTSRRYKFLKDVMC